MTTTWTQTRRGQFVSEYTRDDGKYRVVGLSQADNGSNKRWQAEVATSGGWQRIGTPMRRTAQAAQADVDQHAYRIRIPK